MQQCGDRLILIAAILDHQAAHHQQVREIRDLRPRPPLMPVDLRRQRDGAQEPPGQRRRSTRDHGNPQSPPCPPDNSIIGTSTTSIPGPDTNMAIPSCRNRTGRASAPVDPERTS